MKNSRYVSKCKDTTKRKTKLKISEASNKKMNTLEKIDEKSLNNILRDLFSKFFTPIKKTIERDMEDLRTIVQHMSDCFDKQVADNKKLLLEVKGLREDNKELKEKNTKLKIKGNFQEQKEKQNNLLIVGISKQDNLKDNEAVGKVFSAMNLRTLQQNIAEGQRINRDVNAPLMV